MTPMRCEWAGSAPFPSISPPTQVDTLLKLNVSAHVENRILFFHPVVCAEHQLSNLRFKESEANGH